MARESLLLEVPVLYRRTGLLVLQTCGYDARDVVSALPYPISLILLLSSYSLFLVSYFLYIRANEVT